MKTVVAAIAVFVAAAQGQRTPLLLDADHLAATRARLAADDRLKRALADLEADAARALALKPPSVMDKAVTPPSGDKHDYMSQAPYWWPDPAKPRGLPYIRKDGVRNPEITRISDHDNLGRITSAVATLGLAFHLTGREDYAVHAARLTRVWFLDAATRMHPHLRFGQGIPGITDGRGIGIIETRGLPDLLDAVALVSPSSAWTPDDERGLQAWMREYLTWLTDSPHGRDESKNGNNHETWYAVQVAALAIYTRQPDLARRTVEHATARIARQIEPDGRQPRELERTRAFSYSAFNLEAFFRLAAIGERAGVDLWPYTTGDGRSLRKAVDFLVPYATREREWPYQEISGFQPGALHWVLRRAAVAWKHPKYREIAAAIGGGRPRLDLTLP